ncbi:MAG: hypothetical protein U1F65_02485 [Verrucomicrobiota bacterium]
MITLGSDCLLFELNSGESVPLSAEMITIELTGNKSDYFDSHFVQHAAQAVFHYFKHDLQRVSVTVGEFASALESVLRGFGVQATPAETAPARQTVLESDLQRLARESGDGCELFFFPRLRDEMRQQLQQSPRVLRFRGLRGCVKQLAGAQRWSRRCQTLHNRIVEFLRECLTAEGTQAECALVVE